jgi:hypothetical protein
MKPCLNSSKVLQQVEPGLALTSLIGIELSVLSVISQIIIIMQGAIREVRLNIKDLLIFIE